MSTIAVNGESASTAFRASFEAFRSRFDDILEEWLEEKQEAAESDSPEAADLTTALSDLVLSGGKRIRPALAYHGYRACDGETSPDIWSLAMSLELLHTYLLVHDDIMDRSDRRRRQPTIHVRFEEKHRREELKGNSEKYGQALGILVGDLAHTYAHELFSDTLGSEYYSALSETFAHMEEEVICGQHMELRVAAQGEADPDRLQEVLQLKSGRYSVQRPVQLGAQLAGASSEQLDTLTRYGAAVGEAFQLQDDLLGMFGDPETVGKPVGDDLREGKYTFLIHHTLQRSNSKDQQTVREALGQSDLSTETIEEVARIMQESGAVDHVRQMIDDRLETAHVALQEEDFREEGLDFLAGVIRYMKERNK